MGKDDRDKYRFYIDFRGLQRSVLPYVVLKILSESKDGLIGIDLKDKVVDFMERMFPVELIERTTTAHHTQGKPFELYTSVLYPLLLFMARDQGWIERGEASPNTITPSGRAKLAEWEDLLKNVTKLWGKHE